MGNHVSNLKIKTMFIGTSFPFDETDWRGRFTANVIHSLNNQDILSLGSWLPPGELSENINNLTTYNDARWLRQLMLQGGIAHIIRTRKLYSIYSISVLLSRLRRVYKKEAKNFDVVHVNWLQNSIPLFGTSVPLLISVLGNDYGMLEFPGMKYLLRTIIRKRKCVISPNAPWMAPKLMDVFGDIAEIRPIPYGVDNIYFDINRNLLKPNRRKWIVISRLTKNKIGPLFSWGKGIFNNNNELHLFGPMQEKITLPAWINYHGPVSPGELISKWYPVCSGLITLSRHNEGMPQVMLEAMAAGVPIIASDLPAHRDIIINGISGYIVRDAQEFRNAIENLTSHNLIATIGNNARSWIVDNIGTWDDCADRFVKAYKYLLERK